MAVDPVLKQRLREIAERAQSNITAPQMERLEQSFRRFRENIARIEHDHAVRLDLLRRLRERCRRER